MASNVATSGTDWSGRERRVCCLGCIIVWRAKELVGRERAGNGQMEASWWLEFKGRWGKSGSGFRV